MKENIDKKQPQKETAFYSFLIFSFSSSSKESAAAFAIHLQRRRMMDVNIGYDLRKFCDDHIFCYL